MYHNPQYKLAGLHEGPKVSNATYSAIYSVEHRRTVIRLDSLIGY